MIDRSTELLAKVCEASPHTMRLLLTGYSDLAAIVGSVNEGEVYRFINKPWDNDDLRATVAEAARVALETRAALAAPATLRDRPAAEEPTGLLLLDTNPRVREWFTEHFGNQYQVFNAGSISGALETLEKHDVGILVTDQALAGENMVRLLRILKQQYPMIMTVMLTGTQDSDFVISLINEIKVCRVVFKPLKLGALDLALKAAKRLHYASRQNPVLLLRQGVTAKTTVPDDMPLAQTILTKMRNRFRWFSRAPAH